MKAKDITLIALLSASLTAGKMVLSFIPNVEIVSFLFIIYTTLFGFKRTFATAFIFSTTEIFIYGFGTWLLGYYIIWPTLIILAYLIGKTAKTEYGFAILSGAFGLSFGMFFALFESVFYGIEYAIPYWVRGIPFDIVHGVSNFILMLVLYKPVVHTVKTVKEKMHFI